MKYDLDTLAKLDGVLGTVGEHLNTLQTNEEYEYIYLWNKEEIEKMLADGFINTTDYDYNITPCTENGKLYFYNLIDDWKREEVEYTKDGCAELEFLF